MKSNYKQERRLIPLTSCTARDITEHRTTKKHFQVGHASRTQAQCQYTKRAAKTKTNYRMNAVTLQQCNAQTPN